MAKQELKWDDLTQEQKDTWIDHEIQEGIFYSVDELESSHENLVTKTIEEVLRYLYTKGYLKISNI